MSMEQSDAIVLRVYPWSETSCVASIYARDFGKLSVLAKGARRRKSNFEAALDLLSICRVVFIAKSSDSLDILTEAKLQRRFRAASIDLLRLNCGYYIAELLSQMTDKGEKQPEVFELAETTLADLEQPRLQPRAIVLRFELQLLRMMGHLPSWQTCVHCGKSMGNDQVGSSVMESPDITVQLARQAQRVESSLTTGDAWAIFSAVSGGVHCSDCLLAARHTTRVRRQVLNTLQRFSNPNWHEIDIVQDAIAYPAEIRRIMVRYLSTLLDRQLNLHAYLEELGR